MRFRLILIGVCVLGILGVGCTEEEPLPPVKNTKVRKPIIRPVKKEAMETRPALELASKPEEKSAPKAKQGVAAAKAGPGKKKAEKVGTPKAEKKASVEKGVKTAAKAPEASPKALDMGKIVKKIQFEALKDGGERITIELNGKYPPKIFALEGDKPRVVCDFFEATLAEGVRRSLQVNGKVIREIRTAEYKGKHGKVRVVLDLVPRSSADYQVQPVFYEKQNIYALVVK
jgi:hypothetical protein